LRGELRLPLPHSGVEEQVYDLRDSDTRLMMKIIVGLLLLAVFALTRQGEGSLVRRYLGFVLVAIGSLLWAATFDSLRLGRSPIQEFEFKAEDSE